MRTVARLIVSWYPRPWRERYEGEVLELIDASPVRLHDVGELVRNMLVEHVRASTDLAEPTRTVTRLLRVKLLAVLAVFVVTGTLGIVLGSWYRVPESIGERVPLVLLAFWLLLAAVWLFHRLKHRALSEDGRPPFPVWIAMVCLPVHLVASVLGIWLLMSDTWSSTRPLFLITLLYDNFIFASIAGWLLMQIWPGQRLVQALIEFQQAEGAVGAAETWVARCKEWNEKGVPSPSSDAEAALEQRRREYATALERVQAVGYRAGFQR